MAVNHIDIKRFTVFDDISVDFSPGINVFLGANATGKSHLLKLIYSLLRSWRYIDDKVVSPRTTSNADLVFALFLKEKLAGVFQPDDRSIGRLVRRSRGRTSSEIRLDVSEARFQFKLSSLGNVTSTVRSVSEKSPASIFLPAREVLSMYPGFASLYSDRSVSFDETYYDLCLALGLPPLRGRRGEQAAALLKPLSDRLGAGVRREGDRFYVDFVGEGSMEAPLVAEGLRKLASVIYLMVNGSLLENGILFWDEPEANLNPRLIKTIADFLLEIAGAGIQVFVATHDYLLTNELSLQAEYQTASAQNAGIRFFGFHREDKGPAHIQSGAVLADLDRNPIMEEFAALYDRERLLFRGADDEGNAP